MRPAGRLQSCISGLRRLLFFHLPKPILSEGAQAWKGFAIFLAVRGGFAGDNVIYVANGKSLHFDVAAPCVCKLFNAVGGKDEIEVERSVLQLDKIFAT